MNEQRCRGYYPRRAHNYHRPYVRAAYHGPYVRVGAYRGSGSFR